MIWGGAQGVYTALRNRTPAHVRCSDLSSRPPDAEWWSLSGCTADFEHVLTEGIVSGHASAIYVPLHAANSAPGSRSPVLLRIHDERLIAASNHLQQNANGAEFEFIQATVTYNESRVYQGLVLFGIEERDKSRDQIEELAREALSENFVILDLERAPQSLGVSAGFLIFGLVFLGGLVSYAVFRKRNGSGVAPPG